MEDQLLKIHDTVCDSDYRMESLNEQWHSLGPLYASQWPNRVNEAKAMR
jgi:hypothetical protein